MSIKQGLFWVCVLIIGMEMLYGFYWGLPNIAIRLGLLPDTILREHHELIPTLSWFQELLFFSHMILNVMAFAAILYRWVACIPLFALAFILDRIDWVILTMNPVASVRNANGEDWTAVMAQIGGFGLMGVLSLITLGLMAVLLNARVLHNSAPAGLEGLIRRSRPAPLLRN
ncbi:MAG: hypothetical protein GYB36_09110 [Alphaproteobacteria bacterium]|nr:hypothetical protein [Alphaproteobacteria bacterium]